MTGRTFGIALVFGCTLGTGIAWANDATFGGAGADLVPLERNDVEMKAEDIELRAVGVRWHVKARYVFLNHAAEGVKLQVGFPEYRCESDQESDCGRTAFRELKTKVEGAPVTHRSGTLDPKHQWARYLGTVWLFDVSFPSGKEIVIEHEYSLDAGENVMGDVYTTYVTRTGAGWRNGIGSARFTAILPPYTHSVKQPEVAGMTVHPPTLVEGPNAHVKLVLEARDWKPTGEVNVSFNDDSRYARARSAEAAAKWQQPVVPYNVLFEGEPCATGTELSPEEAQDCRNAIYASKGFPFKKSELVSRYYSGTPAFRLVKTDGMGSYWVRNLSALRTFSESFFNRLDRQVLRELEKLAPAGSAAPTPAFSAPVTAEDAPRLRTGRPAATSAPASASAPSSLPVPTSSSKTGSATPPSTSRCGCRTTGAPATREGALLSLALLAFALGRRRRYASARTSAAAR